MEFHTITLTEGQVEGIIRELVKAGRLVYATKMTKEYRNCSLREAYDEVKDMQVCLAIEANQSLDEWLHDW